MGIMRGQIYGARINETRDLRNNGKTDIRNYGTTLGGDILSGVVSFIGV